ncbi:lytic transglycosylase domain-containing protein [Caballeronia sp. LjRoot29]|uniref:lytic transglycosylase domain-containing protein n=1 Tax=Caballeronia sp. LjRoot29 TaxID=3342315 RepID=UPI003ED17046
MMAFDFMTLAQQCAPQVSPATMAAIVRTESSFNPYAIGVVHALLLRQPASLEEATATVRALEASGWDYSVGLAQVSRANWSRYGMSVQNAFDPCLNLAAGAAILHDCYAQARKSRSDVQGALRASLSCYASGDFTTGYRTGYVQRVVQNVADSVSAHLVPSVPAIDPAVSPIPVTRAIPVVPLGRGGFAQRVPRPLPAQPASADAPGPQLPQGNSPGKPLGESSDISAVVF